MSFFTKNIFYQLLNTRHTRHSANENNLINLVRIESGILQCFFHWWHTTLYQIFHKLFQLCSCKRHVQVFRTFRCSSDERQINFCLQQLRQFHFRLFRCFTQALKRHGIFAKIYTICFLEFICYVFKHAHIEVIAAKMRVAVC